MEQSVGLLSGSPTEKKYTGGTNCERLKFRNWTDPYGRKIFIARLIAIFIMLSMIISNLFTSWGAQDTLVQCHQDWLFDISTPINEFFHEFTGYADALMIVSSLFIDVLFVNMIVKFILWGRSWKIVVTIIVFYCTRGIF
jgi:hypothetical protein